MAGDRGMRYPELAAGALQHIQLPAGCSDGYSSSRTCEVNMSQHSGINFRWALRCLHPCSPFPIWHLRIVE
jgi:D-lactate dehydrogenase